jgi:hypothetical protein
VAQGEGPEFEPQYCKKKNWETEMMNWEGTMSQLFYSKWILLFEMNSLLEEKNNLFAVFSSLGFVCLACMRPWLGSLALQKKQPPLLIGLTKLWNTWLLSPIPYHACHHCSLFYSHGWLPSFFCVCVILGIEPRALCLLGKCCTTWLEPFIRLL